MLSIAGIPRPLLLPVLLLTLLSVARSWSPPPPLPPPPTPPAGSSRSVCRRRLLRGAFGAASAAATSQAVLGRPDAAHSACLPGDLRPSCIGVYKVPMDDAILPYVGTPEALRRFAPDLQFVPPVAAPPSLNAAIEALRSQRLAADDIRDVVSAGRLEEAGIKVLNLLPRVTAAGRLVLSELESRTRGAASGAGAGGGGGSSSSAVEELKIGMLENQFDTMMAFWGECDVEIGQGIRGDMGVSAVAQLNILSSLRDATGALDDFLATALAISGGSTSRAANGAR